MRLVKAARASTHIPRPPNLGAVAHSLGLSARNHKMSVNIRSPCEKSGENEEEEKEAVATAGHLAGVPETEESSDSDLETEGTRGLGELVKDTLYLKSCQAHSVVPASCFLRQGSTPELNLRHRGLGPQGAQALASSLTSNPYVKRLDLRDNELCGAGAEALAGALSKNSSICDVDLSENQLGAVGAQAICATLAVNPAIQKVQLAGNGLEEQAAQYLAELLLAHTGLKSLDLSYNHLNDQAGEILGPALAENTGLTELNISWNHLRGPGAIAFARGLEVSRNPMRSEGCLGVLKSVQNNPVSALELLDFSVRAFHKPHHSPVKKKDIQVNREFDDLASSVKVILPGLCIKTAARRVEYKKELLPVFRPSLPVSAPK
ncbi:Leucine-rich repeat-containing protein LOC400891 [Pteropus alecto]|uniref:Leucine-rich repeat-containing protein LOC400891 n=1 Tax=Pteropus alecto TaxID=9402 RepID=L5KVX6_PTEAL|nr:Leucine-rich repeat-containing protein LOC400891 [Pteropus alecto]